MNKIKILDESVSNIIAAGEVVENPASMIKELLENSLDAGADSVKIEVFNGGKDVKITDNGSGMEKNDMMLSIERHATSKISTKDDIFNLMTYGFRGEALASISSVSKMTISTKTKESNVGYKMTAYAGSIRNVEDVSKNNGTEIEIRDLFYNTPARKKFLRKESTEYNKIRDIVLKEALANYNTAFTLIFDDKLSIKTSGKGIENTILELFGKNVLKNLKKFEHGYLGSVEILRSSKDYIFTYVNKRYVKSNTIERAVLDGYYTKLMKGKYPFAVIFLETDPKEIDVNVHPSKKIVKFSNDKIIYSLIKSAMDDHFYLEERQEWQPNLDLLKQNVNVNAAELEKIENLFSDEVIKGENKQFFSLETLDNREIETRIIEERPKKAIETLITEPDDSDFTDFVKEDKITESVSYEKENNVSENIQKIHDEKSAAPVEKTEKKEDYRIIGQVFNMYILVENKNQLEIYDQHIIHERILYEELKEKFYSKKLDFQNLIIPQKIELSSPDKNLVMENAEVFQDFGFDVDEFGENEIILRSVPAFDFRDSIKNVFMDLLADLKNDVEIKDLRERIIISMSCKGAIKAGQKLDPDEIRSFIKRLHEIGKYTCPHGRPIIINIPKDDLDKMFGRKG
ncbi:DNA mismatch repair endonuclease MutL [Sebaldella sp. S0638]|uniref:DNA mismatch repair endonuclease MutL n=1 Tax=Sebaldella sp. S0638 TaxID=2957809 RepID=UPI00209C95A7|nr:DNA mismatch repair endonuclease MutL [Sebaldella sp. S0638]MCP1224341.1 DNA mismatch repair endonuclease MutL [Sebaldella sp. S0638]